MNRSIVLSAVLLASLPLTAAACGSSGPCGQQNVEVVGGFASNPAERNAKIPPTNNAGSGHAGEPRPPRVVYTGCQPGAASCSYGSSPNTDYLVHGDGSVELNTGW